jgi:hypothetical protein
MLHEMQVDEQPFPINTMELQQPKVLVRLHQAEATKGKNVMVREAKPDLRGKELTREVAYEKTPDVNFQGYGQSLWTWGARFVHAIWSTNN